MLERFFDDTGGMQLVLHSPFGARINRGLGLALRKKFCRTFNFELQAAATDDAIVLSLGLTHSFPLEDVPHFLSSQTVADTLEHAILDSPMFQARWRWNLNRSLMVLRFRNGRRNPPPIQRMESDDLLAAVFPQAAACQDNIVGPIEIPDHVLVRQTIDDTLHEALDIDGVRDLLERIECGEVRVHCRDTTEPSVLAHEIITARPYAFLDDEETQNRRTNAVHLRRGLAARNWRRSARWTRTPSSACTARSRPLPETADDLHDLLSSTVVLRPRADWSPLWLELVERGRGRVVVNAGVELWTTTEACVGRTGGAGRRARGGRARAARSSRAVRCHDCRRVVGPHDPAGRCRWRLVWRRWSTRVLPCRAATGLARAATEWVARRLLARMHGYSKRSRRQSFEPVTAQDLMRFLLRWQHVAPDARLSGEAGLVAVLEQLQGFEAAAAAWETELFARRLQPLRVGLAGRAVSCRGGRLVAPDPARLRRPAAAIRARLRRRPRPLRPRSCCGPICAGCLPRLGPARKRRHLSMAATAEVLDSLRQRGASFVTDLSVALRRLPGDVERALWDGVARGLVMCDGFAAIRALINVRYGPLTASPAGASPQLRRSASATVGRRPAGGRWCRRPSRDLDRHDLAEAVAEQLLNRWGVLFRDLAVHDGLRLPWREIQWALRRLEDRGLVRGGRFVAGFSGEQYALPAAVEQLARVRKTPRTQERVVVNATDPLNLVGLIVPGQTVPAVRTNQVVYVDGLPLRELQ